MSSNDIVACATEASSAGLRLDIWLWAARFYKTRGLAKQAVETGKVEVAGQRAKPSRLIRAGDVLKLTRADEQYAVTVLALLDKRGSASVAQGMYLESEDSRHKRVAAAALRRAERTGYQAPLSKPDKRARRLIQALGDIDAL